MRIVDSETFTVTNISQYYIELNNHFLLPIEQLNRIDKINTSSLKVGDKLIEETYELEDGTIEVRYKCLK